MLTDLVHGGMAVLGTRHGDHGLKRKAHIEVQNYPINTVGLTIPGRITQTHMLMKAYVL